MAPNDENISPKSKLDLVTTGIDTTKNVGRTASILPDSAVRTSVTTTYSGSEGREPRDESNLHPPDRHTSMHRSSVVGSMSTANALPMPRTSIGVASSSANATERPQFRNMDYSSRQTEPFPPLQESPHESLKNAPNDAEHSPPSTTVPSANLSVPPVDTYQGGARASSQRVTTSSTEHLVNTEAQDPTVEHVDSQRESLNIPAVSGGGSNTAKDEAERAAYKKANHEGLPGNRRWLPQVDWSWTRRPFQRQPRQGAEQTWLNKRRARKSKKDAQRRGLEQHAAATDSTVHQFTVRGIWANAGNLLSGPARFAARGLRETDDTSGRARLGRRSIADSVRARLGLSSQALEVDDNAAPPPTRFESIRGFVSRSLPNLRRSTRSRAGPETSAMNDEDVENVEDAEDGLSAPSHPGDTTHQEEPIKTMPSMQVRSLMRIHPDPFQIAAELEARNPSVNTGLATGKRFSLQNFGSVVGSPWERATLKSVTEAGQAAAEAHEFTIRPVSHHENKHRRTASEGDGLERYKGWELSKRPDSVDGPTQGRGCGPVQPSKWQHPAYRLNQEVAIRDRMVPTYRQYHYMRHDPQNQAGTQQRIDQVIEENRERRARHVAEHVGLSSV